MTQEANTVVVTVTPPKVKCPDYLDPRVVTLDVVYSKNAGFGPTIFYEPASFRSDHVIAVTQVKAGGEGGFSCNIHLTSGLVLVTDLLPGMVKQALGWEQ
jgi:hypothetical protein